jgi:tetratricopeptide (TPR) repeat protein
LNGWLHAGLLPENDWHYVVFGLIARAEAERLILGREVSPRVTAEFLAESRQQWKAVRDLLRLGDDQARQGKWKASLDAYVRALDHPSFSWAAAEEESAQSNLSLQMSTVFVRTGDSAHHARLCRLLLAMHPEHSSSPTAPREAPVMAARYARACFLEAVHLTPDLRRQALELARFAVRKLEDNKGAHSGWTAQIGGMAEYHAGSPERSLQLLQEAVNDKAAPIRSGALAYTAMVLTQLNRSQEATEALRHAEKLMTEVRTRSSGATWWDLAQAEIALEQARKLIGRRP